MGGADLKSSHSMGRDQGQRYRGKNYPICNLGNIHWILSKNRILSELKVNSVVTSESRKD